MTGTANIALLVDDNPDDVELALVAFEEIGSAWRFAVARDGVEALDYLFGGGNDTGPARAGSLPAFVLLDLKLPKIDGFEVLQRIRNDPVLKHVFVAVLTSSSEERDRSEAVRLGADLFVQKALDFNEFIEDLKRIEAMASTRARPYSA